MTTPAGLPAWARTADYATYGGDLNKRNYQSQGAVNAQTDVTAEQFASLTADLAAVQRTAEFAHVTFTCNDSTASAPTLNACLAMYGVGASAAPTMTRLGDGNVRLQWASSYTDPYGVSQAVNITGAEGTVHGGTFAAAMCDIVDARTVDIYIKDGTNAFVTNRKVTVSVTTGGA